jgi:hypothetical protein
MIFCKAAVVGHHLHKQHCNKVFIAYCHQQHEGCATERKQRAQHEACFACVRLKARWPSQYAAHLLLTSIQMLLSSILLAKQQAMIGLSRHTWAELPA